MLRTLLSFFVTLLICSELCACAEPTSELTGAASDEVLAPQQGRQVVESIVGLIALFLLFEFFYLILSFGTFIGVTFFQLPNLGDDDDDDMYKNMMYYMDRFKESYDRISHEYGDVFEDGDNDLYYDIDRDDSRKMAAQSTARDDQASTT